MRMKVRNKAAFTDAEDVLERENRQVSYEAALEASCCWKMTACCRLRPEKWLFTEQERV